MGLPADSISTNPQYSQLFDFGEPVSTPCAQGLGQAQLGESPAIEIDKSNPNTGFLFPDLEEYPFLQSDSISCLSNEDMSFLHSEGSYSLPSRELAEEFIQQYFQRVHPGAPVIDEARFWRIWERQSEEKLSLFLFQALLFASCPVRVKLTISL